MTDVSSAGGRRGGLDGLVKLGDLLSKLALIAGAAFAVFQFLEAQRAARVERTSTYIERYEEGRAADARRAIVAELRPYVGQFQRLGEGGVSETEQAEIVLTLLDESEDGALAANIDIMVDFYEGLWTCVRERLCDERVARGYFGAAAAPQFWRNFKPYIEDRRRNNETFAFGLEQFARAQAQQ